MPNERYRHHRSELEEKKHIYRFICILHYSITVAQGADVETPFKLTPYREGLCRVSATFRSHVLSGVRGYSNLQISE